jgi:hypothetical protein
MIQPTSDLLWVGSQRHFDDPPKGFWVAVPVVVRRLIVETPPDIRDSDPFARAVVNLAAAGVQRIPDIAELIGIEDLDFVREVIRRLENDKIITVRSGVVEVVGVSTERSDAVGDKNVWYIVQDTYTGEVWPRVAASVRKPEFDEDRHVVHLGTPGKPATRTYWRMPQGEPVVDPAPAAVRQTVSHHLRDLRTVGIKASKRGFEHLATLGRPERQPIFSARLAPGREDARLLVRLKAAGEHISMVDPFGVGGWFELAKWTELLLDRSPVLRERVVNWAAGSRPARERSVDELEATDEADARPRLTAEATLSRVPAPPPVPDRNTLLLSLADRLREDMGRSPTRKVALSFDNERDSATLARRWVTFGFRVPQGFVRPVPALVERAAEGYPADLHVLFYTWTLLVDVADGRALAREAPDLPALLQENAAGRTHTAIPNLRTTPAPHRSLPTEST